MSPQTNSREVFGVAISVRARTTSANPGTGVSGSGRPSFNLARGSGFSNGVPAGLRANRRVATPAAAGNEHEILPLPTRPGVAGAETTKRPKARGLGPERVSVSVRIRTSSPVAAEEWQWRCPPRVSRSCRSCAGSRVPRCAWRRGRAPPAWRARTPRDSAFPSACAGR